MPMHLKIRVPVNGDAGFLGSHLYGHLLKDGANIICVGNYYIGTRRNSEDLFEEFLRDDSLNPRLIP
jgi:UDP-glucuronate decarboxylase